MAERAPELAGLYTGLAEKLGPDLADQLVSQLPDISKIATKTDIADSREAFERRFEQIDQRFEQIDQRFEQIDQRFEQIDRRFEEVDRRFEEVDRRFEEIDRRFEEIDRRFALNDEQHVALAERMSRLEANQYELIRRFDKLQFTVVTGFIALSSAMVALAVGVFFRGVPA